MRNQADRLTTATAIVLVLGALLACKKKQAEETPVVSASVAPEPPPPPKVEEPKLDEIKRYADKETVDTGTVRVNFANVKVYREADDHTPDTAVLSKGTLVNRKAKFDKFVLIEFLGPKGELSLGWVEARFLPTQVDKTAKSSDVAKQAAAAPATSASAALAPSAGAPAAAVSAPAATAAPSASAAPTPSATATSTAPKKPGRLQLPSQQ